MTESYWWTEMLLIRHGQARAVDGTYDRHTPLSELGRQQAELIAAALAELPDLATVYASPFPRALQTATPLCRSLNIEPTVDPRLAEFEIEVNNFDALSLRPDLSIWRPEHYGIADGETLGAFSTRVAEFFNTIVEQHQGQRVVVFAHAGTIDAALRWALGMPPDSIWQHEFNLSNASISEIEFWPRGRATGGAPRFAMIRRIGDTAHLGEVVSDM